MVLLPAPEGPTMATRLAGLHAERYAVERRQVGAPRIGEANVVELDLARAAGWEAATGIAGERISGTTASSSVSRSAAPAAWLTSPQISEICGERRAGEHRVEHELAEPADRHAAVDHRRRAEPQNAGDAGDDQEHGKSGEHGACPHARLGGVEGELHVAPVAVGRRLLVGERLHGARGGKVLRRVGRSLGEGILRPARQAAHRTAEAR